MTRTIDTYTSLLSPWSYLGGPRLDRIAAEAGADTKESIERGVFGAPSYIYGGELFWGQDRPEFLERAVKR